MILDKSIVKFGRRMYLCNSPWKNKDIAIWLVGPENILYNILVICWRGINEYEKKKEMICREWLMMNDSRISDYEVQKGELNIEKNSERVWSTLKWLTGVIDGGNREC